MSSVLRVFLLLAVVVCISKAQFNDPGSSCLCRRVRKGFLSGAEISNIQVHKPSIFCERIEIVISTKNNHPYCLNPNTSAGKKVLDVFKPNKRRHIANSTSPL